MPDPNAVAKPSPRWEDLDQLRSIIEPLWGGTVAMRNRPDLMPPHEGEVAYPVRQDNNPSMAPERIAVPSQISRSYHIRLQRAVLWPEFRRQMVILAGKVFRKPVRPADDVPARLQAYSEDIDRRGTNLHNFALVRFLRALRDGFSLILVDAPRAAVEEGQDPRRRTAVDEERQGIRPYVVPYDASQLIGVRSEVVNGRWRLTQARLYECSTRAVDEYSDVKVERVRVFKSPATGTVTSETWERTEGAKEDFRLTTPPAPVNNVAEIPLVAVYGNWEHEFFDADPAFVDLALLNIRDWQITSDIDNILRVGIVPKPYATGVAPGTLQDQIWSVDHLLEMQDPGAKIAFAELQGTGVKLAMQNRDDGRNLMKQLALELLMPMRSGQMTDDEVQARSTDALSPLHALALQLQDSLEQVFRIMAQYHRMGDDAGGSVEISTKPFLTAAEMVDLQALKEARKERVITRMTFGAELQRRGLLSDDIELEEEVAKALLEAQGEDLLTGRLDDVGGDPDNADDADEGSRRPAAGDDPEASDSGPGAGDAAA